MFDGATTDGYDSSSLVGCAGGVVVAIVVVAVSYCRGSTSNRTRHRESKPHTAELNETHDSSESDSLIAQRVNVGSSVWVWFCFF